MATAPHLIEDAAVEDGVTLRLVEPEPRVPTVSIRTCTRCGDHTAFVRDSGDDGWFRCSTCGHYG